MKLTNAIIPHRILGVNTLLIENDDDKIKINVSYDSTAKEQVVEYTLPSLGERGDIISNLLKNGLAKVLVQISCPRTLYKKEYISKSVVDKINISVNDISGMVHLYFTIVSTEDISDPMKSLGEIFGVSPIRKGEPIAYLGEHKYNSKEIAFNELVKFVSEGRLDRGISIRYEYDAIIVEMAESLFEHMNKHRKDSTYNAIWMAVFGPLILEGAIREVAASDGKEESNTALWAEYIREHIENNSRFQNLYESGVYLEAAQLLLDKDPYEDLLKSLDIISDNQE